MRRASLSPLASPRARVQPRLARALQAWPVLAVAGATAVGAALRFRRLAEVPPGLSQDEAVNAYDALCLAHTGRDHHGRLLPFSGLESFGDWVSPLLTFLSVPAVGLLGPGATVVRGVSAAAGTAAIPATYRLGVAATGRREVGALAAWLAALSPWQVHLSRRAIPPATVPALVALTLAGLRGALRRRGGRGLTGAAALAGLAVAGYPTMKVYVLLVGLAAAVVGRRRLGAMGAGRLLAAGAVFAALAGRTLALAALDPARRARFDQVSVFRVGLVSPGLLARQYLAYLSPRFLFVEGDGDPAHTPPGFGNELWSLAPLLAAGLAALARAAPAAGHEEERDGARLLLAALALAPVPGALTRPNPHTLRAAQMAPLLAVVEAAGAAALWDALSDGARGPSWARRGARAALALGAAAAVGWELRGRYRHYFGPYAGRVRRAFQDGLLEALARARAHEPAYDEVWVGDAVCPYIYVALAGRLPPRLVQRSLRVRRAPPAFNEVTALGRYRFGAPPGVDVDRLAPLATVRAPEGWAAWEVRGGTAPDGRRLLVVRRPAADEWAALPSLRSEPSPLPRSRERGALTQGSITSATNGPSDPEQPPKLTVDPEPPLPRPRERGGSEQSDGRAAADRDVLNLPV